MDARREPRFELDQAVQVTVLGKDGAQLPARVKNFSGNGLGLVISRKVPLGTAIRIESDRTPLLGEVCYCRPYEDGYLIGAQLEQALYDPESLVNLARGLLGELLESPQHAPTETKPHR